MPTQSPYPPLQVPNKDIYSFLFERDDRPFPENHVLYIDGATKRELTYGDVKSQSKTFGMGLKSVWGWKKGDVVGIYSPNNIDIPPAIWGTLWAGGVISPANPGYTVDELTFQLRDSRAKALITIPAFLPTATAAAANVGIPKDHIILMGDQKVTGYKHWREIRDSSSLTKLRKPKLVPGKDLAFLVYSSGTTGIPKGVMLSHRNLVTNVMQVVTCEEGNIVWNRDKMIGFLPLFHIYGLTAILHHGLYSGVPVVVMERFDLTKFCTLVQECKITFAYLVPPVILLLAKHPLIDNYDLSSLRMINSGAAPLTKDLVNAEYKRLGIPIKQAYGLSETSPLTHTQTWKDWQSTIGSVGKLAPNLLAKYMSEDGKELPVGETGELWVKGDNVMLGYLNNPEATKNAITEDGYFKTGDVGYEDKDGNVFITDRVKELIKYKGFQVPPAELEGLLLGHEKVDDCAVTGVYSEELASEIPRAFVVLKKGVEKSKETEQEIIKFLHEKVANHKRLRGGVTFLDEIPKSISGKILRKILRAQVAAEEEAKALKAKL